MARKIKFALEMKDGIEVRRNLDEMREHFDIEKAVEHFLSGKLQKWLEDRYYDEVAEKIKGIDKNSNGFQLQLCSALGVEYTGEELDVEEMERVNEKRTILRERTSDAEILSHAAQTAFTQEDLADLLDIDAPKIYLCGEHFHVPISKGDKKYIGILGTPIISIQASCQEELEQRGISFEHVQLPWANNQEDDDSSVEAHVVEGITATILAHDEEENASANYADNTSQSTTDNEEALHRISNRFVQNINESYLTDWVNSPPLLIINDYGSTNKSEIKRAVRDAAAEYESEMKDGFSEAVARRLQMLQDIQEEYDAIFQQSGKDYIPPSPTLQEVWQATTKGHQSLLSGCEGLANTLPGRAKFEAMEKIDSWNPFESRDYLLDNSMDLSDFADQHYERIARQYNHSDFANAIRAYICSIKRNMECLSR